MKVIQTTNNIQRHPNSLAARKMQFFSQPWDDKNEKDRKISIVGKEMKQIATLIITSVSEITLETNSFKFCDSSILGLGTYPTKMCY